MYNNIALLVGHMIGDYILQNDWMASNKTKGKTKGDSFIDVCEGMSAICTHVTLYSLSVAACVTAAGWRCYDEGWLTSSIVAYLIAWVCHYPIDRCSWSAKWGKLFKQTNLVDEVYNFELDLGHGKMACQYTAASLKAYFAAPVYIAVDNTMHLFLMWILFSLLGG